MSVRDLVILGCSAQQPTRFRNHGAYLLRWNQEGFLFDPGEGTQRQFIYANVSPTSVTRIFISHFHGDHCLGLGSMFMRFNLDHIKHPIHCYYPKRGKPYFDRLRFGSIYFDRIEIIEHPVSSPGIVHQDEKFVIEADFLDHGVDTLGWRITESDSIKFDPVALQQRGIRGRKVKELQQKGELIVSHQRVLLSDCSWVRKGDTFCYIADTRLCSSATQLVRGAKLLLCESTYLEVHRDFARRYGHLTAKQAATLAKEGGIHQLVLTHFSARYRDLTPFKQEAEEIFSPTQVAEDLKKVPFSR